MDIGRLSKRIDALIKLGEEVLGTGDQNDRVEIISFFKFRSASASFILNLFCETHPYYRDFLDKVKVPRGYETQKGIGILYAINDEICDGWLESTRGLISADIFGDFIEMAEHLLAEGYKDPAAVIIGSSLEQHLKNLCLANNIEVMIERNEKVIPKKADQINSDLVKGGVYSKLDQKSVTFWLGIRNNAAHGQFDQYNEDQVKIMLSGVLEFINRTTIEL